MLFSGPQVTDAARADLKNEMTKKGVRKTIVNDLLGKLLAGKTSSVASTATALGTEPTTEDEGLTASSPATKKPTLGGIGRSATAPVVGRSFSASDLASTPLEETAPEQTVEITDVFVSIRVIGLHVASLNCFTDCVHERPGK